MSRSRSGGRDSTSSGPARSENGCYVITDGVITDGDQGEFDYGLKEPGTDPPAGQSKLAERLRLLYGWSVDYVPNDDQYRSYLSRLKGAFHVGAVQEPVNLRESERLMDEIEHDLVVDANKLLRADATRSAIWYLSIVVCFSLIYTIILLLAHSEGFDASGAENYLLIAAAAVAALAVRTRVRTPISRLADYRTQAGLYEQPIVPGLLTAVLVVGVTVCIQNKLVTLTLGGASIDVQKSVSSALALGFILGLTDVRLLSWITQRADHLFGRSVATRQARS